MNLSLFVLLFALIGLSQSGIVQPINRTPILVSSNNINEISSYTFTFLLETPTTDGDILVIKFPLAEYSHFSALVGTTCTAYLNPETFRSTNTNLACGYSSDKQFEITLVELNSGPLSPHSVTIVGLQNPPNIGGTGNFQVETRRGLANTMDENGAFNQLGFVASPSSFSASSITITANGVINQNGTYAVAVTTTQIVPQLGFILLTLPTGSKIYSDAVCTFAAGSITAACTRLNDLTVKVTNFSAAIPAATAFTVTVTKILNLNYVSSSGNMKIQTWTDSVNTIIEQVNKAMPSPTAGTISSASKFYTNFQQTGLTLIPSDYTSYEISFRVTNPVPSSGAIEVTLPSSMTPDYCIPFSGLNSIDESHKTTCTITGSKAQIITFKPLAYNQLITVMLRATNPVAGTTGSVTIQTFYDTSSTLLIDQLTSGFTFTIDSTLTKMKSLALTTATTAATAKGAWTITWQSTIQLDSSTPGIFDIIIPTGFTFDGTPVCSLKPAAGSTTTVPCTLTGNTLNLGTSTVSGTFSNTADNTLTITSSNSGIYNAAAGDYPIIVKLKEGGVQKRTQTLIYTVTSATTLGATVTPLTVDRSRFTLYEIAFTAPTALSPGIYPENNGDPKSTIRLEFQTSTGTVGLFAVDLGRNGTTNSSTIPCYGADALKPFLTTGKLRCILYIATTNSTTTPAVIEVHDFAAISSGQRVTLQIPKIKNSDSMTASANVAVYLKYSKNHISKVTYTNTVTLAASLLDAVVGSPNNTNGVAGVSTNLAPTFNPKVINQVSRAEVKLTPGPGRALAVGSKIILDFPSLPYDTATMQYIFDSTTRCEIGLGTNQPCLVFPEVGWIVIKNLVSAFNVGQEYSLTLFNIKNPRSAAALAGSLRLVTIATTREYEEYFYTAFTAFKTGSLSNINIFPSRFEANQVDVEYNWIFVISNPIPAGGSIELRFPPNLYNLESDPPVTGTVITGLSDGASTTIAFSFIINVVTITGFAPVPAGTLIRVSIKGVRNPIEATRTTNFAIVTKDSKSYLIDSELLISGLNILKANPVGVIVFNYFYTTPSNGKMRGNYYLSFYPQNDYPAGTTIQVIFPSTEFNSSSFKSNTCSISGALTTFKSCTAIPGSFRYDIITDTKLEIEPGMLPINVFFPQIMNFNEELSSGVIVVRALYDGVVLDESGNAEDNRKAATSLASKTLSFGNFSYTPKTEGQTATYTVDLNVSSSFDTNTVIQFEFPWEFQRGLGEGVDCQVPALLISATRPIKCVVQDRIVNITGHSGFNKTQLPNGFRVSISGIVNPNQNPPVNGTIAVFILTTPTYASEHTLSLGNLSYANPPKVLDMIAFTVTNTKTRITADYGFQIVPSVAIPTNSRLLTEFSSAEYNIDIFSKNPTLSYKGGSPIGVSTTGNRIIIGLNGSETAGSSLSLTITGLANPLDEGEKRYPTIYCLDDSSFAVTERTYDNLIKPSNFKFAHAGEIVTINNDLPTTIHPGQADKYTFQFQSPTTLPLTIHPTALSSTYLQVSDITVPVGSTEASIWIGVDSAATNDDAYVHWDIIGDTANRFWVIRPLTVNIVVGQTEVYVDEIVHVPAGGRTKPLYVTLSKSPLTDLTILLYQRGSIPTEVNVYPSKLTFKKGELSKPFWVSSGRDTKGIMGSIMFLINGTNANAYYMPKRLRSFIVSRGDTSAPLLFAKSMPTIGETYVSLDVTTSEPCTMYYFVAPKGTLAPLFQDIKDKKIRYDYYGGEYVVGEYVDDDNDNRYLFNVNGLRPGTDYDSYFFIEDFGGNLGTESFTYTFTTAVDYPRQVWINVNQASVTAADTASLISIIASVLDISSSRLESDTTVLNAKSAGGAATGGDAFDNSGRPNKRVKLTAAAYSPASAAAGTSLITFIVFPPIADPFELSNAQTVAAILSNIDQINSLYKGGGKVLTAYGVQSNPVEPDDIKWASGTSITYEATTSSIIINGLALNAAGTIHALAITDTRPVYYSTQDSLQSAVRYLAETEFSLSSRERKLVSSYGQQECVASSLNELAVSCTGQNLPAPDRTRDDYDFYNTPPLPSSYQVATESDGSYFKGDAIASISYTTGSTKTVTLSNLKSGTKYTVYLGATDGYSKYPVRMMDTYLVKLSVQTVSTNVVTQNGSILATCLSLLVVLFGMIMV